MIALPKRMARTMSTHKGVNFVVEGGAAAEVCRGEWKKWGKLPGSRAYTAMRAVGCPVGNRWISAVRTLNQRHSCELEVKKIDAMALGALYSAFIRNGIE